MMLDSKASDLDKEERPEDEAVRDTSYKLSVLQVIDAPHKDQHPVSCVLCTEDREHNNDSIISDIMLQLKEPHSSFHDQGYVEKIEEFQFYLKKIVSNDAKKVRRKHPFTDKEKGELLWQVICKHPFRVYLLQMRIY